MSINAVKGVEIGNGFDCINESGITNVDEMRIKNKRPIFLTNNKLVKKITKRETLLMVDDLGSELDVKNLRSLIEQIILSENQIVLTGIEGEEMHQSIKKLTNFTQINL